MRFLFVVIALLFCVANSLSQEQKVIKVDSLYKEDQFYAGVTYNLLSNKPTKISQSGFSLGFHLGFIKDMPINKRRNLAIGIGLGYSTNSFNQNLLIDNQSGYTNYSALAESNYSKNKFSQHIIEIPFEFRWRTSTASEYSFWRIYTGFKAGYMMSHSAKYNGDLGSIKLQNIEGFNKFQYGLTLSVGYNTWNLYAYYALNSVFSNKALIDGNQIEMKTVKLGLVFYIL